MRKSSLLLLLILFTLVNVWGQIPSQPNPPRLVNDYANILSSGQRAALERKLVAYDDSTSTQILVIIMPELNGYPISEFSYELGDQWGVGQKGKDNGLVLTVAIKERETFIATGWGIEEYITDVTAKRIVNGVLIPNFKQGNFYRGIDQATNVMIGFMEGSFTNEDLGRNSGQEGIPVWLIILIIVIIIIILNSKKGDDGGQINRRGWSGPIFFPSGGSRGGGGFGGGSFGGGGGFGGFGGGSFGGGGAGGSW